MLPNTRFSAIPTRASASWSSGEVRKRAKHWSMIFYIFLQFSVYAFIVLLPLFGANVYLDSNIDPAPPPPPYYPPNAPPLPPQAPDGAFVAHSPSMPPFGGVGPLSGIATLSLSHLPPGSPRFWASSLGMFILTLIFLILARREFEVFIQLRLNWLSEPRPQLYAARLITYKHRPAPLGAGGGAAPRPSGEDMASALKPLFGEGLARCLAVPRHPFWPGLVSKGLAQLDKAGGHIVLASAGGDHLEADPVREAANKGLWEELKMLALGEDFESSYILLFRTRSARFAAMNSNTVLTNAKVGGTILSAKVVPAAAPHDCDWGALSTPRWIIVLAWIGIILFFGFWNVPVALAQSIASVASISRLMSDIGLGAVSEWLLGLSPSATSIIEGYLPSLVLAGLVILAYEIMPVLSRLQAPDSGTSAGLSTQRKFWLFNYLIIILASCIVGSLIETADKVLDGGTCVIFSLLGRSIPEQGSFWLNYILQDMLFLIPVMDMLMLSPAACFIFCGVICGCCCNSMCGMNGWFTQYIVKACQKLRYYKFYGRSSIVISATFLFCCIQPLILTITLPWTIFISRVWAHNHKRVLFHPLEVGFDPGGHYWLLAMRQLSYSVLLAQLALAAVHAMNQSYGNATLLLLLMWCTWFRFGRMIAYYSSQSLELPLEECARLDAEAPADDEFLSDAAKRYQANFFGAAKRSQDYEAAPVEQALA